MPSILSRAKEVLVDVPRHGKLAYCLLRDERVPAAPKAVLLGALALIVSPIDLPAWVPLMGELDMLALGVLADSTFDRDFHDTVAAAREGSGRLFNRIRRRVWRRDPYQPVSEG